MSDSAPTAANASLRGGFLAAIFLMATSAIGPGFITQTATFTQKLGAAFAFAILASIVIDFVVQLNIWRITALTRRNASATANAAIPGSGYLLAVLILIGGIIYSAGVIFHVWEKLRFQNAIWHGFVVTGAAVHYSAVLTCFSAAS